MEEEAATPPAAAVSIGNWSAGDADRDRERSPHRDAFRVSVFEMDRNGVVTKEFKSVGDILRLRDETRLPIR